MGLFFSSPTSLSDYAVSSVQDLLYLVNVNSSVLCKTPFIHVLISIFYLVECWGLRCVMNFNKMSDILSLQKLDYPVQVDTGSSDVWIKNNSSAPLPGVTSTVT